MSEVTWVPPKIVLKDIFSPSAVGSNEKPASYFPLCLISFYFKSSCRAKGKKAALGVSTRDL